MEALTALERASRPRTNKYLEAYKHREPRFPSATQRAGMCLDHVPHVLFGGSAGGGKSSWILGEAAKYLDVPGYASIIFRRKYTDLMQPDALIPRSHEWLKGTDAHWQADRMQWAFPSGAVLKFGYMDGAQDHLNYQGAAFQSVNFDESGQMVPTQMEFMQTRARRLVGSNVPIRFRYTANPGGSAHDWLVQRFMLDANPSWVFISSLARDNPGLDVADYMSRLDAITDPVLRAQMRDGDWSAVDRTGLICPEWTPELEDMCTSPDYGTPNYYTVYAGADPGNRDLFVLLWGFLDFVNGRLVIVDERQFYNPSTPEVGDEAAECERIHFAKDHADGRIDGFQRFTDIDHRFVQDLKAKPWHLTFNPTQKTDHSMWERKMRGDIKQGRIHIHPRCELLLRTLRHARRKENGDYERTKETGHADAWAALLYMYRNVNWQRNPFPAPRVGHGLKPEPTFRTHAQRAANGALPSVKPL